MKKKTAGTSPSEQSILDRINANPLVPQQMLGLAERIQALEPGNRGFEGHAIATIIYFQEQKQAHDLSMSAMFRLEALFRLIAKGKLPGWTKDAQRDGSMLAHEGLVIAAGQCPVVYRNKRVMFSRKDLLHLAFRLTKQSPALPVTH